MRPAKISTTPSAVRRYLPVGILVVVVLIGWVIVWGVLNSGRVRKSVVPHALADLQGEWVLDNRRGEFALEPPETIRIEASSGPELLRITDGERTAEFEIAAAGFLAFPEGSRFDPLLREDVTRVQVMTHLCPPLPAWDHLTFYPDGMPEGGDSTRRSITYERE